MKMRIIHAQIELKENIYIFMNMSQFKKILGESVGIVIGYY